jgi:5'-3' exoribonuclease 2
VCSPVSLVVLFLIQSITSAEERQDQNSKRRKIEATLGNGRQGPSSTLHLTTSPTAPPVHPSLPPKPVYDFAATADSIGFGAPPTAQSIQNAPAAAQALAGSNRDVVANRRAIRMANMSAAEMLKAELGGELPSSLPAKPDLSLPPKPVAATVIAPASVEAVHMNVDTVDYSTVPGLATRPGVLPSYGQASERDISAAGEAEVDSHPSTNVPVKEASVGIKRKLEEDEDEDALGSDDDEIPPNAGLSSLKVNKDGTVEQEDTVKYVVMIMRNSCADLLCRLWEPGYKQRYYRQKFNVDSSDQDFKKQYALLIQRNAWLNRSEQINEVLCRRSMLGFTLLLSRGTSFLSNIGYAAFSENYM